MAIVINGSGTITGISAGGLPTGSVTADSLATDSVDSAELIDGAIDASHLASGVGVTNVKTGNFSKNSADATADVAYTGIGFEPTGVIFFVPEHTTDEMSWGFDDGTSPKGIIHRGYTAAGTFLQGVFSIDPKQDGSNYMTGVIKSFDSDGFTVTYTKTGSPTGSFAGIYMAIG